MKAPLTISLPNVCCAVHCIAWLPDACTVLQKKQRVFTSCRLCRNIISSGWELQWRHKNYQRLTATGFPLPLIEINNAMLMVNGGMALLKDDPQHGSILQQPLCDPTYLYSIHNCQHLQRITKILAALRETMIDVKSLASSAPLGTLLPHNLSFLLFVDLPSPGQKLPTQQSSTFLASSNSRCMKNSLFKGELTAGSNIAWVL